MNRSKRIISFLVTLCLACSLFTGCTPTDLNPFGKLIFGTDTGTDTGSASDASGSGAAAGSASDASGSGTGAGSASDASGSDSAAASASDASGSGTDTGSASDASGSQTSGTSSASDIPGSIDTAYTAGVGNAKESPLYNENYDTRTLVQFFSLFPDQFPVIDSSTARKPITASIYDYFISSAGNTACEPLCSKTHGAWLNLADGFADLVFLVAPTQSEQDYFFRTGASYMMKTYGYDGLAFMVNNECPVKNISQDQIRGIYECRITNWKELGGPDADIHPYFRNSESGSQRMFVDFLWPDGDAPDFQSMLDHFWFEDDMESITDAIYYDPYAIGYNIVSYLDWAFSSGYVDMVGVDGIVPTTENFSNGTYPYITRATVAVNAVLPKDSPARRLYEWIGSEESIELIRDASSLSVSVGDSYLYDYSLFEPSGYPECLADACAWRSKDISAMISELDRRCLTFSELASCSEDELNLLRNGVYALSGKIFKNEYYRNYYKSFSWYDPRYESDTDATAHFTNFQLYNLDYILAYTKLVKGECNYISRVGDRLSISPVTSGSSSDPEVLKVSLEDNKLKYQSLKPGTATVNMVLCGNPFEEKWVIVQNYAHYFPIE